MEKGDRIIKVGEDPVNSYSDIRISLLGSRPGEPVDRLDDCLSSGLLRTPM